VLTDAQQYQTSIISVKCMKAREESTNKVEQEPTTHEPFVPAVGKMETHVPDKVDVVKCRPAEEDDAAEVASLAGTLELMEVVAAETPTIVEATKPFPQEEAANIRSEKNALERLAAASAVEVVSGNNRTNSLSTESAIEGIAASEAKVWGATKAADFPGKFIADMGADAARNENKQVEGKAEAEPSVDTEMESAAGMITEGQLGQVEAAVEEEAATTVEDRVSGVDTKTMDQISKENCKQDATSKAKIPLHRLMADYIDRKRTREKVCRVEGSRKSARPKKAPDTYVAEPASYCSAQPAQKIKGKLLKKMARRQSQGSEKKQFVAAPPATSSTARYPWFAKKEDTDADSWEEDLDKCREMNALQSSCAKQDVFTSVLGGAPSTPDFLDHVCPSIAAISPPKAADDSSVPTSPVKSDSRIHCPIQCSTPGEDNIDPPRMTSTLEDRRLADACMDKRFPEQLMLLMTSSVAGGRLWWTPDGAGKTFAFDVAYFRDDVMNRFFPPNPYRRITVALKRWYVVDLLKVFLFKRVVSYGYSPNFSMSC
jgi:hypothetical protein